jgi:hypothetical protein
MHDDIGNNTILLEPMEEVEDLHDTTNIEPEPASTTSRSGSNIKSNSKYQEYQEEQRRRRERAKDRQHKEAFHIIVNEGLNKNKLSTIKAMFNEVMQINSKSVWIPKTARRLTRSQMQKVIRCSFFMKEKYHLDGTFNKIKGRLVAGGNQQIRLASEDTSSSTAHHLQPIATKEDAK